MDSGEEVPHYLRKSLNGSLAAFRIQVTNIVDANGFTSIKPKAVLPILYIRSRAAQAKAQSQESCSSANLPPLNFSKPMPGAVSLTPSRNNKRKQQAWPDGKVSSNSNSGDDYNPRSDYSLENADSIMHAREEIESIYAEEHATFADQDESARHGLPVPSGNSNSSSNSKSPLKKARLA